MITRQNSNSLPNAMVESSMYQESTNGGNGNYGTNGHNGNESKLNDNDSNNNNKPKLIHAPSERAQFYVPYSDFATYAANLHNSKDKDNENKNDKNDKNSGGGGGNREVEYKGGDEKNEEDRQLMGQPYSNHKGSVMYNENYTADEAIAQAKQIYYALFPNKIAQMEKDEKEKDKDKDKDKDKAQDKENEKEKKAQDNKNKKSIDYTMIISIAGSTNEEQRRFIRRQYDLFFSDKLNAAPNERLSIKEKKGARLAAKTNTFSRNKKAQLLTDLNDKLKDKQSLKYLLCGLFTFKGEFNAHLVHTALIKSTQITKSPNLDLLIEVMCTRFVCVFH